MAGLNLPTYLKGRPTNPTHLAKKENVRLKLSGSFLEQNLHHAVNPNTKNRNQADPKSHVIKTA